MKTKKVQRLRWFGHIMKITDGRKLKKEKMCKPSIEKARRRGKSR